jgi:hypothetical protein
MGYAARGKFITRAQPAEKEDENARQQQRRSTQSKENSKDPEQEKDETGRAKYSRRVYMCLLLQHTQRIASESNAAAA